uniref:phospholipase ABHD3 isoform X1 n=1 Tax=Myxine glutinosa TaxID=7769 RepID=UPI00358E58EF
MIFTSLAIIACSLYALYYLFRVVKRPKLVGGQGFCRFLELYCPFATKTYYPTFWCCEGRLNTLMRPLLKRFWHVSYRRELIDTPDGGQLSLHWLDNDESEHWPDVECRPTVIFLPGLTGTSQESYLISLVRQVQQRGYRCIVFHNRGLGGAKLLTPRTYSGANTDDLETVVRHVKNLHPSAPLLATGISLGGNIVLNYLGNSGCQSGLLAAVSLCPSWDAVQSITFRWLDWLLFNGYITRHYLNFVRRHRDVLQKRFDVDYILQSKSVWEFDDRFTAVMFGYQSTQQYHYDASPCHKISSFKTPVLVLNSTDDPFNPKHTLPLAQAQENPHVALVVTSRGGHIGFLEGAFPRNDSYMDRIFGQFCSAAFEHREELTTACQPP